MCVGGGGDPPSPPTIWLNHPFKRTIFSLAIVFFLNSFLIYRIIFLRVSPYHTLGQESQGCMGGDVIFLVNSNFKIRVKE